jgi:GT2 family glycosyltransferase
VIVAVMPSRGRPAQAARLVQRCSITSDAQIALVVDRDDPTLDDYAKISGATLLVADTRGFAPALNVGAEYARQQGAEAIMWLGDDVWPVTDRWAEALLSSLDGGPGIAYGDDLIQRGRMPTHPLVTMDLVEAVGYFSPPGFVHLYVDNVWRDIGIVTGRLRYVRSVILEHRHPAARKAPVDESYARTNSRASYERDGRTYLLWQRNGGLKAAVGAVLHLLKGQTATDDASGGVDRVHPKP